MKRARRTAQTLLELVAATTIITIALVPALRLTRDSIADSELLEIAELRLTLCTSKLEEEMARTAATWDLTTRTGDYRDIGRGEMKYMVLKSDASVDGGIPGRLTTINVIVWFRC